MENYYIKHRIQLKTLFQNSSLNGISHIEHFDINDIQLLSTELNKNWIEESFWCLKANLYIIFASVDVVLFILENFEWKFRDAYNSTISHLLCYFTIVHSEKDNLIICNYILDNVSRFKKFMNAKDCFSRTPLFYNNQVEMFDLMVEFGSDIYHLDQTGHNVGQFQLDFIDKFEGDAYHFDPTGHHRLQNLLFNLNPHSCLSDLFQRRYVYVYGKPLLHTAMFEKNNTRAIHFYIENYKSHLSENELFQAYTVMCTADPWTFDTYFDEMQKIKTICECSPNIATMEHKINHVDEYVVKIFGETHHVRVRFLDTYLDDYLEFYKSIYVKLLNLLIDFLNSTTGNFLSISIRMEDFMRESSDQEKIYFTKKICQIYKDLKYETKFEFIYYWLSSLKDNKSVLEKLYPTMKTIILNTREEETGYSFLHYAVYEKNVRNLTFLLNYDNNETLVNVQDLELCTPMHILKITSTNSWKDIYKILKSNGAHLDIKDSLAISADWNVEKWYKENERHHKLKVSKLTCLSAAVVHLYYKNLDDLPLQMIQFIRWH